MNIHEAQEQFDEVFVRLLETADNPGGVLSLVQMRVIEAYLQSGRTFDQIDAMLAQFVSDMRASGRHD